jgi:hypothetical protein
MHKKAPAAPQTAETQAFHVSKGKTPGTADTVLVKQIKSRRHPSYEKK